MPRPSRSTIQPFLVALVILATGTLTRAADPGSDSVRSRIEEGIERNFAGDWTGARTTFESIRSLDPTHPAGWLFPVTSLWWTIALDPGDPTHDERMVAELERAIELAQARIDDDPDDVEALFYWGQALGYLGRLAAERGRFYQAGTLGEDGRVLLERALDLEPSYEDPKFPLGAYYYFASLVPGALRWFDFLWFIPKGSEQEGLRLLEEARSGGELNGRGASFVLLRIYARFHEGGAERALAIGTELRERYPDNAVFHLEMARVLGEMGHTDEALATLDEIDAKVRARVRTYDDRASTAANVWRARALMIAGRVDDAEAVLRQFGPDGPTSPRRARAWVLLTRGEVLDSRGRRKEALAFYDRVRDLERPYRDTHARVEAARFQDEPFSPRSIVRYRTRER